MVIRRGYQRVNHTIHSTTHKDIKRRFSLRDQSSVWASIAKNCVEHGRVSSYARSYSASKANSIRRSCAKYSTRVAVGIPQPWTTFRGRVGRHVRTYRSAMRYSESRASSNSSKILSHGSAMKAPFSTPLPGAPAITSMRILTSRRRSSDITCSTSLT
jgi:hypothetical protein